jgi:hypothetical protein
VRSKPQPSRAGEGEIAYDARRAFRIDHAYRDTTDTTTNEFYTWLGVKNSGGIRASVTRDGRIAAIVLVSSHISVATYNPWDDVIDVMQGRVWYWGDAKAHPTKQRDDWQGNRYLQKVWTAVGEQRWADVPPILHFSKLAKGEVKFMGLCVLKDLQDAWLEDDGKRVRNYRAVLDILPVQDVSVAWIRGRAQGLEVDVPQAWRLYAASGVHDRLVVYAKKIRSRVDQLPPPATTDESLLHSLNAIDPFAFERIIVRTFEAMEVGHDIQGTRAVRDGGFDFFGEFRLPPPLAYSVPMKGEVKRYDPRTNGVGPKDVARLVARLQRGEHGVFVTSSYFTTQAQEEVFEDRYPVELIYGRRLVGLLSSVGAIRDGRLDPSWLTDAR